ncbi:MAG: exo-alpha-sialidase [Marinoscillum sp.]
MKFTFGLLAISLLACCGSPRNAQEKKTVIAYIDNPSGGAASLPHLILGGDNLLYFSWLEQFGDSVSLRYSRYEKEWSEVEEIASGVHWFVNWADYPMISSSSNGGLLAHFLKKSNEGTYSYDVNLKTKSNGEWSSPFLLHTDSTPTEHGFVTMLPLSDSTFQVAWLDGRNTGGNNHSHGGAMTLRTAVVKTDGTLTEEKELDSKTCDCCQTGGAMTSQGPVFVYRDRSELEIRDISIVRKEAGRWTEPTTVAQDNWNIAGCPVNGPRIDAINNTLSVAWFTGAKDQPQVKLAFSTDGGRHFQDPIIIDNNTPLGRVDVVMLDEQSAMISWLGKQMDKSVIKAKKVYITGISEPSLTIAETSDSRGSGFPQMEKYKDSLFFAWTVVQDSTTLIKMAKIDF